MAQPMTWTETFVRAYARDVLDRMTVSVDRETGATTLVLGDRSVYVKMGDLMLRDDAFERLGHAVEKLLGVAQ